MTNTAETLKKGVRQRFVIKGCLCTLNEYTRLSRANRQASARIKRDQEEIVGWAIKAWLKNWRTKKPVYVKFTWVEKNKRKDKDNIAFAKKFIFDALVKNHVIPDDKWDNVVGFSDVFHIDKNDPRVIVDIYECGEFCKNLHD